MLLCYLLKYDFLETRKIRILYFVIRKEQLFLVVVKTFNFP